jgi:glycosyltransferase involved in cell wall biosynthesis
MKVLLAHNFYRSSAPSGEDSVYRNEKNMLENKLDVVCYERHNDNIDDSSFHKKIKLGLDGAWSKRTYNDLTQLIHKTRPDVAHFHNTFPQISSSAYAACQDNGVPVVQTLHNFRFICPNALLLREGRPCEDCLNDSLIHSLRHRCYRDSVLATGAQVWTITSNRWRGTYINNVNRYIALTSFAADKFASAGLPEDRIEIKPNFLPETPDIGKGEGGYALYVGRLSEEKGVKTLIEAWQNLPDLRLKVLGDGPLRQELEATVDHLKLPIEFLGYCTKEQIIKTVSSAVFQIIPSTWYEGFPMVALEAYACGTPLVVSQIGSLNEIVIDGETGVKFQPGNAAKLLETIANLLSDDKRLALMRNKARSLFKECYTAESNFSQLMVIYQNAILDFNDAKERA